MPLLPPKFALTTAQQVKAIADPLRARILGIIQHQPATAKQLADRLGVAPGSIGHHLQILETAGLAQIVARRLVHGIVAKYYTRTARIFTFEVPPEVLGESSLGLELLGQAHGELAEALGTSGESACLSVGFPHLRLSPERARVYQERLEALASDLINEPPDADGQVYGLSFLFFLAPSTLQASDVQPPEPLDLWESPPFDPTVRNGRLYARGVADDKAEIISRIAAIRAVKAVTGSLPMRVKFLIEGEEESGR